MFKRHDAQSLLSRKLILRNLLLVFFSILLLLGLILVVSSIWTITQMIRACPAINKTLAPTFVALASGVLLVLTSWIGLFVVRRGSSQHMIRIYALLLSMVFWLNVISSIISGISSQQIGPDSAWSLSFANYLLEYPMHSTSQACMDTVQRQFLCCGVNSFTDWMRGNGSQTAHNQSSPFPESCRCSGTSSRCQTVTTAEGEEKIHYESCLPAVRNTLAMNLKVILIMTSLTSTVLVIVTCSIVYITNKVQHSSVVGSYIVRRTPHQNADQGNEETPNTSVTSVQSSNSPFTVERHRAVS